MKQGQGFARKITLANLEKFAPLLRKSPVPTEELANASRQAERVASNDPAYSDATKLFGGKSIRVDLPFKKPKIAKRLKGSPQAAKREIRIQTAITLLELDREQGYHYPQGVHIGHLLAFLDGIGKRRRPREFSHQYIRLAGRLGGGRLGTYRRELKFRLLGAIRLGLLVPTERTRDGNPDVELTPRGKQLSKLLSPLLDSLDLRFAVGRNGIPSTVMALSPKAYNQAVQNFLSRRPETAAFVLETFLGVPAVRQMLTFLRSRRARELVKKEIHRGFFQARHVRTYCEDQGIPIPTQAGAEHRCPFLLNVLEACSFLEVGNKTVTVTNPRNA